MIQVQNTLKIDKILESRSVILQDHPRLLNTTLKSVFTGSSLVTWLIKNYNPFNLDNEGIVKKIQEELSDPTLPRQLIYPIEEGNIFEDCTKCLYRFIEDQFKEWKKDRHVLNLHGVDTSTFRFFYEEEESRSFMDIFSELQECIQELYSRYLSQDKSLVNYTGIEDSEIFHYRLLPITTKLAYLDLSPLYGNANLTKAFFVNIYNILNIHSIIAHSRNKKKHFDCCLSERKNSYKYIIGGHSYTMDDIENGILRKNCPEALDTYQIILQFPRSPKSTQGRFKDTDPRRKFVLNQLDPRIHFALNQGASSSGVVKLYNLEEIDCQLEIAAREYCNTHAKLKEERGRIYFELSDIFKLHKLDFAKDDEALINYIMSYKQDEKENEALQNILGQKTIYLKYKRDGSRINML